MQPKDCQGKAREVTHLMILNPNHAFKLDSVHHACETSIESSNFVHQKTCSKIISAGFTNKSNCTTHLSWKEIVKRVTRTKASSWILICDYHITVRHQSIRNLTMYIFHFPKDRFFFSTSCIKSHTHETIEKGLQFPFHFKNFSGNQNQSNILKTIWELIKNGK